tara:strand:+ start:674 stop:793 length:120 start_codon:yes stop_codon:yes gene_type:complete
MQLRFLVFLHELGELLMLFKIWQEIDKVEKILKWEGPWK